jgi:hypothetical protein
MKQLIQIHSRGDSIMKISDRITALQEFDSAPENALFNQQTIAHVRSCSTATLERDRWAGGGIPFVKINRAVRYRKSDVLAWINQHAILASTSELATYSNE